jgi:hypothetical protein
MTNTNNKPLKSRINDLEAKRPQGDDHEYKKTVEWTQDDRIVERFYRDGQPITRREYMKATGGKVDQITMDWGSDDETA